MKLTEIEKEIDQMPSKFLYQHYQQVGENLVLLEPWGWISVINLNSMTRVNQFRAYERANFTVWLGVTANEGTLIQFIPNLKFYRN